MTVSPIDTIRGAGGTSPFSGKVVKTTGTVTYVDSKGFGMEDVSAKSAAAIYVYTHGPASVVPGDKVNVTALVTEYRPFGADLSERPHLELKTSMAKDIELVSRTGRAPPPLTLGLGGLPVTESVFDKLEGARVRVPDALVVGAPNQIRPWADMYVIPDSSMASQEGRTAAGGIVRNVPGAPLPVPVRVQVGSLGPLDVGARFTSDLVGHVVFRFGRPQIQVDEVLHAHDVVPSRNKPEISKLADLFPDRENTLFIGSLNVENKDIQVENVHRVLNENRRLIDDDLGDGTFTQIAKEIAKNLRAPDIMALQEMQDNDGAELSDVVSADKTYRKLIEEIVKAGGPRYEFIDLPPKNNAEGGMPGGNIRNGFLYNPKRVSVDPSSIARFEDPAFRGARAPVMATFKFAHGGKTESVTVMSVHNKSKRGGDAQTDALRAQESEAINQWARAHQPKGQTEHLAVLGDRNAYSDEAPIKAEVAGGVLTELGAELPEADRYSSQFNGYSGELDHATVSTKAKVAYDIVHMNADFDDRNRPTDHDGVVTAWQFSAPKKPASTSKP